MSQSAVLVPIRQDIVLPMKITSKRSMPAVQHSAEQARLQAAKLEAALALLPADHPARATIEESVAVFIAIGQQPADPGASDNTREAVIDRGYHWRPITTRTPQGQKMQLINRDAGCATYGKLGSNEKFFSHWAPLPTFLDE